jgi:hypothetical protein
MSEPDEPGMPEEPELEPIGTETAPEVPEHGKAGDGKEYSLGRTSDPDGAHRDEPAGEDYAGSGF